MYNFFNQKDLKKAFNYITSSSERNLMDLRLTSICGGVSCHKRTQEVMASLKTSSSAEVAVATLLLPRTVIKSTISFAILSRPFSLSTWNKMLCLPKFCFALLVMKSFSTFFACHATRSSRPRNTLRKKRFSRSNQSFLAWREGGLERVGGSRFKREVIG
jgi:hypothetical protein